MSADLVKEKMQPVEIISAEEAENIMSRVTGDIGKIQELSEKVSKSEAASKAARAKVKKAKAKAEAAAEKADNLKEVKFGKKKAAIEELQATVRDMSNAQSEAVDAQFVLAKAEKQASEALRISFECQSKLGEMAKAMVQYSVSNVAHSRIVVRELEARLNGANREELSDLARQELESVCAEIQRQQDIMAKQEQLFHEVHEHDKQLVRVREENEGRDQAIAAQVQKSVDIVQRLAAQAVRVNEQQKILYTHQEKNAEHDRRLDEGEQRDARQDELLKQHSQTDQEHAQMIAASIEHDARQDELIAENMEQDARQDQQIAENLEQDARQDQQLAQHAEKDAEHDSLIAELREENQVLRANIDDLRRLVEKKAGKDLPNAAIVISVIALILAGIQFFL